MLIQDTDADFSSADQMVANIVFDDIYIGQTAILKRTLCQADIEAFAIVSGDTNPAHLDADYASHTLFHGVIGHGMWGGALISTVLGTQLPGPGTIYLEQNLKFLKPVRIGDQLTISVTVLSKNSEKKRLTLDCKIINQHSDLVLTGQAVVLAPTEKVLRRRTQLPHMTMFDYAKRQKNLLASVSALAPVRCAVVHPCDVSSLQGALEAGRQNLIIPVLIGPKAKILALAQAQQFDLSAIEIIDVAHSHAAADMAVALAAQAKVEGMMKGSLHTDELMQAVVRCVALRTKRRLSHVFHMDVPMYDKVLLLTDCALNIAPTLMEKADILQNVIDLAHVLQIALPKVAILSAVETISPKIASTIEAAALCKMVQRQQITGAIVDGPLAFDNAISIEAARIKGIDSPVAGQADILMVPDLESGNMLAKQLEYLSGAASCGIVLGARVPIALTSRADGVTSRVASAALLKLMAHHYRITAP